MRSNAEFDLTNKVILLTGSAGHIGREVADAYVAFGATVILTDISPDDRMGELAEQITQRHPAGRARGAHMDVTDPASVEKVFAMVRDRFSCLDVLVNLAALDTKFDGDGDALETSRFEAFPIEALERSMQVNVIGLIRTTQAAARLMLEAGRGSIINVGSTYSLVAPNPDLYDLGSSEQPAYKPVDYVASKSVIPNLSRYLAAFYGRDGIRCNCITPHGVFNGHSSRFTKNFSRLSPLGRMSKVHELRGPFIFLASDASSYMNGSVLVVDGGWSAW